MSGFENMTVDQRLIASGLMEAPDETHYYQVYVTNGGLWVEVYWSHIKGASEVRAKEYRQQGYRVKVERKPVL